MHFGLRLPSFALGDQTASLAEMGAYLRRAEDLGFDTAMLIDHLLVAPPAYRTTWLEPITLLAALSGVTRTIQLGTLVLVLPFREPVQFAKQWATLDQLSGGRSILGVGVGWMEAEFEAVGIPHRERGARMNELLELITALWTQDNVTYEGRFYRVRDLSLDPKPAQRPHPPIWIGGGTQPSEKIYGQNVPTVEPVLRRIAKYARTWVPHSSATAEMVDRDWDDLRRYMLEYGRRPEEMSRVYSNFVHVLRPGERPEDAAPLFRVYSGMDLDYWQRYYLLGEAEEVADRIRAKVEALGGVDHLVLNPLELGPGEPRATGERRSAEGGGLTVVAGVTSALPPYLRPDRLDEALAILASEPRLVVAGGTDVYPAFATRPIDRPVLDITALPGLRGLADEGDAWRIPALTTWTDLAGTPLPPELDGLRAAARTIGGRQIQNAGTVCGNVVNASPAADGLPNLLALDAAVEVASAEGERVVADRGLRARATAGPTCGPASWSRAFAFRRSPAAIPGRRASPGRRSSSWARARTS